MSSTSGRICCFLPFLPLSQLSSGSRGKLALLLLLSPTPFACYSAKPPSAGAKRGQKYVCSVMEEQSRAGSGSAEQRCAVAPQRCALCTTGPSLPPLSPSSCTHCFLSSVLPGHWPHHDQPLCSRSGPSPCTTSHLHFSLWPSCQNTELQAGKLPGSLDTFPRTAVTPGKARYSATAHCSSTLLWGNARRK